MPNKRIFPRKDKLFNDFVKFLIPYLDTHKARLKVTTAHIDALNALLVKWNDVYPLTQRKMIRDSNVTEEKNKLRKELEKAVRAAYGDIPRNVLTTKDESVLHIKAKRAKRKPREQITEAPFVGMKNGDGGTIRITCRVKSDADRPSRHPDAHGIEVKHQQGDDPPKRPEDCPNTFISTTPVFIMSLGQENAGLRMHAWFRWVNISDHAKSGPWSHLKSKVISD